MNTYIGSINNLGKIYNVVSSPLSHNEIISKNNVSLLSNQLIISAEQNSNGIDISEYNLIATDNTGNPVTLTYVYNTDDFKFDGKYVKLNKRAYDFDNSQFIITDNIVKINDYNINRLNKLYEYLDLNLTYYNICIENDECNICINYNKDIIKDGDNNIISECNHITKEHLDSIIFNIDEKIKNDDILYNDFKKIAELDESLTKETTSWNEVSIFKYPQEINSSDITAGLSIFNKYTDISFKCEKYKDRWLIKLPIKWNIKNNKYKNDIISFFNNLAKTDNSIMLNNISYLN